MRVTNLSLERGDTLPAIGARCLYIISFENKIPSVHLAKDEIKYLRIKMTKIISSDIVFNLVD